MNKTTYQLVSKKNEIIDLDSDNYILNLMDIEPIDVSLSSYSNNGQAGITITNRKYEERNVAITGYIFADSKTEMRILKSKLQRVVNPMNSFYLYAFTNENQEIAKMNVEYESYSDYYIMELNASTTVQYSKQWFEHNEFITKFVIEAVAANPFWKPSEETTQSFAGWVKDFHFPYVNEVGTTFTFGHLQPEKIIEVDNIGDVSIGVTVYFKAIGGTIKNPQIINIDTYENLKLNTVLKENEEIVVSTGYGNKTAQNITTGKNLLTSIDMNSTFLQLPLGTSKFKWDFDTSESTGTLECYVIYTPLLAEV